MAKVALIVFLCFSALSCKDSDLANVATPIVDASASSQDALAAIDLAVSASVPDALALSQDSLAPTDAPIQTADARSSVYLLASISDAPSIGDLFIPALDSISSVLTLDSGEVCSGLIGTPAEIASTPRKYLGLELVAMSLDGNAIVASENTYDRVVADVTSIATLNSSVSNALNASPQTSLTPPSGSMVGRTLFLTVDDVTYPSMQAGSYSAWDCLNAYYGLTTTFFQTATNGNFVTVVLKGTYNTEMILGLYKALPGVVSAASGVVASDGGKGSIQHICAGKVNDAYQYAFKFGSGDCESGCMYIEFDCYQSTAAGVVAPLYGGVDGGGDQTQCMNLYTQLCQAYKISN